MHVVQLKMAREQRAQRGLSGRAAKPGASLGELHDANTETAGVAGRGAGGRVRDLGRIFKPKIKVADPSQRFERMNEMIASASEGHWRRAGRMSGNLETSKSMEAVEGNSVRRSGLALTSIPRRLAGFAATHFQYLSVNVVFLRVERICRRQTTMPQGQRIDLPA